MQALQGQFFSTLPEDAVKLSKIALSLLQRRCFNRDAVSVADVQGCIEEFQRQLDMRGSLVNRIKVKMGAIKQGELPKGAQVGDRLGVNLTFNFDEKKYNMASYQRYGYLQGSR